MLSGEDSNVAGGEYNAVGSFLWRRGNLMPSGVYYAVGRRLCCRETTLLSGEDSRGSADPDPVCIPWIYDVRFYSTAGGLGI